MFLMSRSQNLFIALLKIETISSKFCNNLTTQVPAYSGARVNGTWRSTSAQVPVAWLLEIIDFISFVAFPMFCLVYLV